MGNLRYNKTNGRRADLLPLLLLADPSPQMLEKYLDLGETTLLEEDGAPAAVAVMLPLSPGVWELKNLAVREDLHRRGYGSRMMAYLLAEYGPKSREILVGTSPQGVAYYQRFGFTLSHVAKGFFSAYPQPVVEDGVVLTDMIYLAWRNRDFGGCGQG